MTTDFFDENPVIDDTAKPRQPHTLTFKTLPTDLKSGDVVFVNGSIVRGKSGSFELRPPTRRDRLWAWIERSPRLKGFF